MLLKDKTSSLPDDGSVRSVTIDNDNIKWLGTKNGLVKFDGKNWQFYNTSNSGLPNNTIISVAIDSLNNKWIATYGGGLAKFDNTNWTVYNTTNSSLPNNNVRGVTIENGKKIWVATEYGVALFDGSFWTTYNTTNSGLPNNEINDIAIDKNHTKWIVTSGGGIAKFSDTSWTIYNSSNSPLKSDVGYKVTIDSFGNKWFGLGPSSGLGRFNDRDWSFYNISNSPLPANAYGSPSNVVYAVEFDKHNNALIGVWSGGFAKLETATLTASLNDTHNFSNLNFNVFPNPTSTTLNVTGITCKTTLKLYDSIGKLLIEKTIENDTAIDTYQLAQGFYTIIANDMLNNRTFKKIVVTR